MTNKNTERNFAGPFKQQLEQLAGLISWLQNEHDKSFVKAGDNKVYAYGGGGFVLVLDEDLWNGQIELITPQGGVAIKPGDGNGVSVAGGAAEDEATLKQRLKDGVEGVRRYYENRYWSTPTTSS
jgi:hypothetical protein